jgi:hypothetical protein
LKAKVLGRSESPYSAETIDQLTEKQFDISTALAGSIRDARRDAERNLSSISAYKDNVFKKYADALETRRCSEKELEYLTKLHGDSMNALGRIKKSDPAYITIAKSERKLKRNIQQRLTDIFNANQQIAFADTALKNLNPREDQSLLHVMRLDQVENFTSNSLEYARNQKKYYDMTSGGDDVLLASQTFLESLSKTLTLQAKQLQRGMRKNKDQVSKLQYNMAIPDALFEQTDDYATEMFDVTKGMTMQLENRVQSIMNEYGHPPT